MYMTILCNYDNIIFMKYIKTFFIFLIFFIFSNVFCFEYTKIQLENGLDTYIVEDKSNPICNIIISVKAGFSYQNKDNTGFFDLYSKLFWYSDKENHNKAKEEYLQLGSADVSSQCNFDDTRYSISFPAGSIEPILKKISIQLINPFFSDTIIREEFTKLKNYAQETYNSSAGFINSTIDEQIFYAPWQQDSFNYAALRLLKNNEIQKIRGKLSEIKTNYYIPNNCAIFITSPYSTDTIIKLIEKYFLLWKAQIPQSYKKYPIKELDNTEFFVLVSDDFSTDYNQIVIEYSLQGINYQDESIKGLLLQSILENPTSNFKNKILNTKELTIDEQDFINANFTQKKDNSRLIIQGLIKNNNVSPTKQVDLFYNCLTNTQISQEELDFAKKTFLTEQINKFNNTKEYLSYLVFNWLYPNFKNIQNIDQIIQNINIQHIKDLLSKKSHVFLLVHPTTYKKHSSIFKKNNYTYINKNTKNAIIVNQSNNKVEEFHNLFEFDKNIEQIIANNIQNNIINFNLTNDIPVYLIKNNLSNSICLTLEILEGEFNNKPRGLQTILTKAIGQNVLLQIPHIRVNAFTNLKNSYITLESFKEDFPQLSNSLSNALFFSDITHGQADELINGEKQLWRLNTNTLNYQQKLIALSTIYKGTSLEKLFENTGDILLDVNYNQIRSSYANLLNANNFRIIISGNFSDIEQIKEILQKDFGQLKGFTQDSVTIPEGNFTNITLINKLKRIFTSDIPQDKAPKRPLHLIPTLEFYDPAKAVVKLPQNSNINPTILKASCLILQKELNNQLEKNKKLIAEEVNIEFSKEELPIIYINFEKVYSTNKVKELLMNTLKNINSYITDNNIIYAKNNYIINNFTLSQSNYGLTQLLMQSLNYNKTTNFWINEYLNLKEATKEDFFNALTTIFDNCQIIWIFSKDSPKER